MFCAPLHVSVSSCSISLRERNQVLFAFSPSFLFFYVLPFLSFLLGRLLHIGKQPTVHTIRDKAINTKNCPLIEVLTCPPPRCQRHLCNCSSIALDASSSDCRNRTLAESKSLCGNSSSNTRSTSTQHIHSFAVGVYQLFTNQTPSAQQNSNF